MVGSGSYTLRDTLNLSKELTRTESEHSKMDEFDIIVDMKLYNDGKTLKFV